MIKSQSTNYKSFTRPSFVLQNLGGQANSKFKCLKFKTNFSAKRKAQNYKSKRKAKFFFFSFKLYALALLAP